MNLPKIFIAGSGNLAWHLAHAFCHNNIHISGIWSKNKTSLNELSATFNIPVFKEYIFFEQIGIFFLCVNDSSIEQMASKISSNSIIIHCAGSVHISEISKYSKNVGVFYPLQTLKKKQPVCFKDTPILLEYSNNTVKAILTNIAEKLNCKYYFFTSEQRFTIHIAAVFANNFSNFMFTIAQELLENKKIDFSILNSLIKETAHKAISNGSFKSQTGPSFRNDLITIEKHLSLLNDLPNLKNFYSFVSNYISKYYHEKNNMLNFKEKLTSVEAFVLDVDGVFSGNIYLSSTGEQWRSMNIKDGYAVQLAVKKGFPIAIITGGVCEGIKIRFEGLGVKDIYLGSSNKNEAYNKFIEKYKLNPEHILYMGDDLPDYEIMKKVGVPVCPSDAATEIIEISCYVSNYKGGEGCVRDVIEQVLKAQGKWFNSDAFQW